MMHQDAHRHAHAHCFISCWVTSKCPVDTIIMHFDTCSMLSDSNIHMQACIHACMLIKACIHGELCILT